VKSATTIRETYVSNTLPDAQGAGDWSKNPLPVGVHMNVEPVSGGPWAKIGWPASGYVRLADLTFDKKNRMALYVGIGAGVAILGAVAFAFSRRKK